MEWTVGIQRAIDYIESHIDEELDYADIARQAVFSVYYFQRIFGILCGVSVGEYIRQRRLTLAGSELILTDERIIDIALKYGYESPESFTRAFSKYHGVTPSEARKSGAELRSFSRLSVEIKMKGGNYMNYKIVEKPSFRVIEKVETHSIVNSENKKTIPAFWKRAHTDGTMKTLLEHTDDKSLIFGICYGNAPTDSKTFEYSIASYYCGDGVVPDGYRVTEIPARTWAVFKCVGAMPDAIQKMWHRICSEFFPASGYEPTYEMDIEAYTDGDMTSDDYRSEIWLPIVT